MQPTETPESNRTPEVEPAIRHTVPWRVTSVDCFTRLSAPGDFCGWDDG